MDIKKRLIRTVIIVAVGLSIGALIALLQINGTQSIVKDRTSTLAGVQIGGDFTLVDHNGKTVTQEDFAGQYKLLYFGFTYCPAICPTELQKMVQAKKALPDEIADSIALIFISVDPKRDTPEVLKDYVGLFDDSLVGLTGSQEQINTVKSDYRVYSNEVPLEDDADYTVDHSSFIYLMSPDNTLLSIYRMKDDASFVSNDLKKHI